MCVALVSALVCFDITPTIATELTSSRVRLEKLLDLIGRCEYSFHDLSYLKLDGQRRVPRFNIPFELGLAVGLQRRPEEPRYQILETKRFRLHYSLSDLNGIDPLIYDGTPTGLLRVLANRLSKIPQPTMTTLTEVFGRTRNAYRDFRGDHGWIFEPACFRQVVTIAGVFLEDFGAVEEQV